MDSPKAEEIFKSESVEFIVREKPHCIVEFDVKVAPAIVKKARKEAIKAVAKEVTIPGFRKGKAPDELIVKRFPKAVEEKWHKEIADLAFKEAEGLARVPLLNGNAPVTFNMKKHSVEEGAEMTFSFEREPIVPEISLEELHLESVKRPEIDEGKIEETLRQIRLFFAEWKKVLDRPIEEGDFTRLDVDIIDEEPAKRLFSDTRFEVTDKGMAKWMKDLVMGLSAGQSKEGMSNPDEDAPEEDKENLKPRKVRVVVKTIEEAKLPEVNAAFAQKIGAKDEADLREKLKERLNKQADEHARQAKRDQISQILLDKYQFELPKSMIDKETAFRFRQLFQDPSFQHRVKTMNEEEIEKLKKEMKEQAAQAIRLFYISRKIVAEAKIHVSSKQLFNAPTTILDAMFQRDYLGNDKNLSEEQKALALSKLMLTKAHDYVIDQIEKKSGVVASDS